MKLLHNFTLAVLHRKTQDNKQFFGKPLLGLSAEKWLAETLGKSFAEVVICNDVSILKKKQSALKAEYVVCLNWDTPLVREKDLVSHCDNFLRQSKQVNLPSGFIFNRSQGFDAVFPQTIATGAFLQLTSRTLPAIFEQLRKEILKQHSCAGIALWGEDGLVIERGVKIFSGAQIYAPNILRGNTSIGKNTIVFANCDLADTKIGADCVVKSAVAENAVVGSGSSIGPFVQLRPDTKIGKNCKIGNFVEVKNSVIGDGVKAAHLAYIGDADIGNEVNIGCGVIFVNYNGKEKFRTQVGNHAFVGSNVNLIAPLKIQPYGYIAAGTTVTETVFEGDLVVGRVRPVVKEGGGFKRLK